MKNVNRRQKSMGRNIHAHTHTYARRNVGTHLRVHTSSILNTNCYRAVWCIEGFKSVAASRGAPTTLTCVLFPAVEGTEVQPRATAVARIQAETRVLSEVYQRWIRRLDSLLNLRDDPRTRDERIMVIVLAAMWLISDIPHLTVSFEPCSRANARARM